jgi:hypothetical protein
VGETSKVPYMPGRALEKVMSTLNALPGPITHRSPLAQDEVVRLKLAVRDWFRLMRRGI